MFLISCQINVAVDDASAHLDRDLCKMHFVGEVCLQLQVWKNYFNPEVKEKAHF